MTTRLGIAALIPTFGEDVVAIFEQDEGGNDVQVFEDATIIQAKIDERATFYKHPLETGKSITDHRIIEPVAIEFKMVIVDAPSILELISDNFTVLARDVYTQIREFFIAGTLLSIQTRTGTYRNQIIQAMPHEESSDIFDGITLSFNSSELQVEEGTVSFVPFDDTKENTIKRGKQNPVTILTSVAIPLIATVVTFSGFQ